MTPESEIIEVKPTNNNQSALGSINDSIYQSMNQTSSDSSEPSTDPSTNTPTEASLDFIWSEYESHINQLITQKAKGKEIFPQPSYVVKINVINQAIDQTTGQPIQQSNSQQIKLFINVCTHNDIDEPKLIDQAMLDEIIANQTSNQPVSQPTTSSSNQQSKQSNNQTIALPELGSLRLPLSVGPLTQCVDKNGDQSISVDVILHPSALSINQPNEQSNNPQSNQSAYEYARYVARRDGIPMNDQLIKQSVDRSINQTINQSNTQLKYTIAQMAIERVISKYGLSIDQSTDQPIKLPKLTYKGVLPPPPQMIRNKPTASLPKKPQSSHEPISLSASQSNKQPAIQSNIEIPRSKGFVEEIKETVKQPIKQPSKNLVSQSIDQTTKQSHKQIDDDKPLTNQSISPTAKKTTKPNYELKAELSDGSTIDLADNQSLSQPINQSIQQLIMSVELPGIQSSAQVDATVTEIDCLIDCSDECPLDHSHYHLQVSFPVSINQSISQSVSAKFSKKTSTLTLKIDRSITDPAHDQSAKLQSSKQLDNQENNQSNNQSNNQPISQLASPTSQSTDEVSHQNQTADQIPKKSSYQTDIESKRSSVSIDHSSNQTTKQSVGQSKNLLSKLSLSNSLIDRSYF